MIDTTFDVKEGEAGLTTALARIAKEAASAIDEGYSFLVLSDRNFSSERVPVSPLLATGRVHHHLVERKQRSRIGLIVESGESREVHQFCTLVSGLQPGVWLAGLQCSRSLRRWRLWIHAQPVSNCQHRTYMLVCRPGRPASAICACPGAA